VGGREVLGGDAEAAGQQGGEGGGGALAGGGRGPVLGQQRRVPPEGLAVAPPIDRVRPARQRLARIPLPLPVVQHPARSETGAQPASEAIGERPLVRAQRGGGPLRGGVVVGGDEGRLAAHGEAHVLPPQIAVDGVAQRLDRGPLVL